MTSRPAHPAATSFAGGPSDSRAGAPGAQTAPASASEVFGRFVRTLEQLDVARNAPAKALKTPARKSRERKAETRQSWEVPGCGTS